MSKRIVKIGNAQGFWGDSYRAPARLIAQQPDLDYLTLDYLAELSMSILAIQKEKDSSLGYAKDFIDVIHSLIPFWLKGSHVKVVTNAGGLNPVACGKACAALLKEKGCYKKIGIVTGDNVLSFVSSKESEFPNLETGESIANRRSTLVTANAYLGAKPIAEALKLGAEIIITGRVADPSLTVGPCVAYHGWNWKDYDYLANATVAGHLIECGTQVTGGISTDWLSLQDPANIGFPFIEMAEDGSFVLTKPEGTAGRVNEETVKEQLLYEIGNPDCYLSPDVEVSFLNLKLQSAGKDRIHLSGALGRPPPETYKVSATFRDGFKAEGMLTIFGEKASIKAKKTGEVILERVKMAGYELERSLIECLGQLEVVPGVFKSEGYSSDLECVLRVCVEDHRYEALECFIKEFAPMVTSGPPGVVGYATGRPKIRQVFSYWPCLIERSKVKPHVEILEVQ